MNDNLSKPPKSKNTTFEKLGDSAQDFRPSEFMRARRPELFSDSKILSEPHLSSAVFEYHLDSLTSRKQETEFEYFCRRLAEKEICPNLLPQTGPTGGGDSKVDSETYPVADAITLQWYEGVGREAGQERWAFAFSAKKDWRSKVQGDVEKIVGTKRGYKLIYFITNQFVKDKIRAQVEEVLQKEYKINIRILDRSWITKRVFENNRLRLAAETLKLTGYDQTTLKMAGPHDTEREMELEELERQIDDPARYQGVKYQLAEDCLQTALLARGLERPRIEVDGRFQRAEQVAIEVDHRQQRLRIVYAKAWTAFWWYNDFEELNRLYDQVEELSYGSKQVEDLQLVENLWMIVSTTAGKKNLDIKSIKLDARTGKLKRELGRLAADISRPNNALQANASSLFIDLKEAMTRGKPLGPILINIKKVFIKSESLTEFPVESIMEIIQSLGEFLTDNIEYDKLFEVMVSISKRRTSEGAAGRALLQRGSQKLRAGKKYDAIRLFGLAQQKLALDESRSEWIAALAGCSFAYEAAGLLWAARSNMLLAANQALSEYWRHGKFIPQALRCIQRLVWLELQLGRVFYVLAWMELSSFIASQLVLQGSPKEAFIEEREAQDVVLGLLLLKTDLWELKWLDFFPLILEDFGLYHAQMALLYALGYEDYLRSKKLIPESESPEAVHDLFVKRLEQPANKDLPDLPELLRSDKIKLRSFVLGCEVIVEVTNTPTSIYLAETILGALEALLATSLDGQLLPYRSALQINIRPSDFIDGLPEYQIDEIDGGKTINVRHALITQKSTPEERETYRSWLMEFVIKTTFQIAVVNDPESFKSRIIRDELGFGRALMLSDGAIALENIFSGTPKFRLLDWQPQTETERFVLRRNLLWNHVVERGTDEKVKNPPLQPGKGEPPDDLFGIDSLKHKDLQVVSLINIPLWDKAEWRATAYICFPDTIPILALGFLNPEAGKQIFKEWRTQLGKIDNEEQLRVSIITEIDQKLPSNYKVLVSGNPKQMDKSKSQHLVMVARINRMNPPDLKNLNYFLKQYRQVGRYAIAPVHLIETRPAEPFLELVIEKRELRVCPAWQIGENDQDVVAIQKGDTPIIPIGLRHAPVVSALKRFAKRKKRK